MVSSDLSALRAHEFAPVEEGEQNARHHKHRIQDERVHLGRGVAAQPGLHRADMATTLANTLPGQPAAFKLLGRGICFQVRDSEVGDHCQDRTKEQQIHANRRATNVGQPLAYVNSLVCRVGAPRYKSHEAAQFYGSIHLLLKKRDEE